MLEYQSAIFAGTLYMVLYAGVTELADVLDLGSSVLAAWEFKSLRPHQKAICGSDSVVECDLAKVEVAGSNPSSAPHRISVKLCRLCLQREENFS